TLQTRPQNPPNSSQWPFSPSISPYNARSSNLWARIDNLKADVNPLRFRVSDGKPLLYVLPNRYRTHVRAGPRIDAGALAQIRLGAHAGAAGGAGESRGPAFGWADRGGVGQGSHGCVGG